MQLAQLQCNALAQIARADAGGLERLHRREHTLHVLDRGLDLGHEARADLFQVVLQIAIVGDGIGDHARDRHVDGRQLGELQLLDELLLQGLAMLIAEIAAAVVIARPGRVRRVRSPARPRPRRRSRPRAPRADRRGGGVAVELGVLLLDAGTSSRSRTASATASERELVLGLEHDVGLERLADMRLQVERGELQQPDGLLQLRRHGELLADAKLQTWLQHIVFRIQAYSLKS